MLKDDVNKTAFQVNSKWLLLSKQNEDYSGQTVGAWGRELEQWQTKDEEWQEWAVPDATAAAAAWRLLLSSQQQDQQVWQSKQFQAHERNTEAQINASWLEKFKILGKSVPADSDIIQVSQLSHDERWVN